MKTRDCTSVNFDTDISVTGKLQGKDWDFPRKSAFSLCLSLSVSLCPHLPPFFFPPPSPLSLSLLSQDWRKLNALNIKNKFAKKWYSTYNLMFKI